MFWNQMNDLLVVQLPGHVQLFGTPWTAACQVPVPHHLLKFAQVHVHCIWDAIQPSHPQMPSSPFALNLSQHQGLFQSESAVCMRWPKYWSFSFSISPFNEYSGLISFRLSSLNSLLTKGLLGVFSNTTFQRHQFFGILPSLQSSSHNSTWPLGRP